MSTLEEQVGSIEWNLRMRSTAEALSKVFNRETGCAGFMLVIKHTSPEINPECSFVGGGEIEPRDMVDFLLEAAKMLAENLEDAHVTHVQTKH